MTPDAGGGGGSGSGSDDQSIACVADLAVTGTFTASATLDPLGGCQPQGTWVVTVAVASMGTCASVPLKSPYTYTLTGTGRDTHLMYTPATGEEFVGAVNASGSGGCEGSFEHILGDSGKFDQVTLKPLLPLPTTATDGLTLAISGTGTFDLWTKHP